MFGNLGKVYRGFHTGTKDDVAIKFEAGGCLKEKAASWQPVWSASFT